MRFRFSDEQEMLRAAAREFVAGELTREVVRALDAGTAAPHRVWLPRLAALGWTAIGVPAAHGGVGGAVEAAVVLEELGRASPALATVLDAAIGFGGTLVGSAGSAAQQDAWLPRVARGEMAFAHSLPAPDAADGRRIASVEAVPDGSAFVLGGDAGLVAGAAEADCLIVAARTGLRGAGGTSLFAVDPAAPGVALRRVARTGLRGAGGLYETRLAAVRVPREALVGPLDRGLEAAEPARRRARLGEAAACVGCAQQAIDDAVRYANERTQFGQPIGRFQAIAHLLADLQVELDAARWLVYRAAWRVDGGAPAGAEVAMAGLAATGALLKAASETMRVFGGYGLTMEFDVQRHFRDARLFVAGDAAVLAQRERIAAAMGL
ncbi:MAG: acyl-CoA dehydrogenase family protein [Burkholderiales bacterium]|nr:acyl-CoA dehydrogenase family protein [Burkholderiales bacterium]